MPTLSHKIRLTPTLEQRVALAKACGCARFAWNWALARYKQLKEQGAVRVSINDLKKEFNQIKEEQFPWIYDSPKDANQHPFANLKKALSNFYSAKRSNRNLGYPKFKRKGERDSFYISNDKFSLRDQLAKLPVIGIVKMAEPLRFEGKIMSGTVSRTANDWFLSVQVQLPETYSRPNLKENPIVGIDLGIKTFVVTSDHKEFQAPKPLKMYLKRLKRLSRRHSKKVKGSSNREKSNRQLAKLHQRIANIRQDFIHKLSTKLVQENQILVVETLNVKGMTKNRRLSRALSDVGFGEFLRQIEYKAVLHNRVVIKADRWFPSSKTCSACGSVKTKLDLSERDYTCESCGVIEDRDYNAALNLRDYGLSILNNKLPEAIGDVKPVEIQALASDQSEVKLGSMKQEFSSELWVH